MAKRAMTKEAKEAKAQAILDKAKEMFLNSEYSKIKMSDIAAALGMSNGILFVYFPTKETLFLALLKREYENRIARLLEIAEETGIRNFSDFKKIILIELEEVAEFNPLFIRLQAMCTAILEKNITQETMLEFKTSMYSKAMTACKALAQTGIISKETILEIFMTELSIITGCRLSCEMPSYITEIIEKNHLDGFKKDFKKEVVRTMSLYLDGYEQLIKINM